MKGQQAAPGALDGRAHWESQEANPLPSLIFRLRSALPVTGFLAAGPGSQESNVYGVAQTRTRLLGRQMFRTPVCKRTRHLDFPPKLCSNSIFKPPQPARVARASACSGQSSLILNCSSSTSLALALGLALCTWKYDHEFLTATVEKAPPAVESDVLPPGGAG